MTRLGTILVIDDEEIMREVLETLLTREGYDVRLASSGPEGLEYARSTPVDAAIVDVMMPDMDGLSVLDELKKLDDEMAVIMITAFASVDTAVAAMKRGAFDYITKPFKNDEVLVVLRNAVERKRLETENRVLRQNLQERYHKFDNIIGRSPRMRQVFDLIIQAAPSRSTILIQGESGTGKELVARALHTHSARADRAFVTVNSGNLPPDLLESNLFGHVRGAFTGAVYPKKGLFEVADRGSIFFDEIGNIPIETQPKLLRVIQEREFMRLGGVDTIKVDVRIIAATNKPLEHAGAARQFREDLFYRLNVVRIHIPPLRDRREDIPLLVNYFLKKIAHDHQRKPKSIAAAAVRALEKYHWPGNVRELENIIRRAHVIAKSEALLPADLPKEVTGLGSGGAPVSTAPGEAAATDASALARQLFQLAKREPKLKVLPAVERELVIEALKETDNNQVQAAKLLGITRATLRKRIEKFGIQREMKIQ